MAEEKGADHTYTNEWGTWSWNDEVAPAGGDTSGLSPDALAWVESLIEATGGEWVVPGAGIQTAEEWVGFLSTEQGKGWWGSLTPKSKETLMPFYTEAGEASTRGAAQGTSTRENPVLSLPWLQGKTSAQLPSAEHQYGVPTGGGGFAPSGGKKQATSFLGGAKTTSVYREGLGAAPSRVAPSTRWLLF